MIRRVSNGWLIEPEGLVSPAYSRVAMTPDDVVKYVQEWTAPAHTKVDA